MKTQLSKIELEQKLAVYDGEDRVLPATEVLKFYRENSPKGERYDSKIPTLDRTIGGFYTGQLVVISGLTGQGKCHGKGTKILMYDGTVKNVENIKIGDALMGDDSLPRTVLSTTTGSGELYEVSGKPGVSYVVNEDHVLCLKRTRGNRYRTDTKTISPRKDRKGEIKEIKVKDFINSSKAVHHLFKGYKVSVKYKRQPTEIEPYFLGAWLGDGHSDSARITTEDKEVVDYLKGYSDRLGLQVSRIDQPNNNSKVYSITKGRKGNGFSLQALLRKNGLLGNKHIPQIYKSNCMGTRLQLLAGIIDTDGYVAKPNGYQICLKSKKLSDDIVFLANSVGLCSYFIKSREVNGTTYYRIAINGDVSIIPVKIERKKLPPRKQKKNVLVYAIKITPIGKGNYYGFQITGNGRYLLSDCTVTHNTTLAQTFTRNMSEQLVYPLWFSYEVSCDDFLSVFPADHMQYIYMPLKLKDNTLQWIEERILESRLKNRTTAVFIDHIHYLVQMNARQNMSFVIGETVRGLKQIALRYNVVIFLIAHMVKTRPEEEPGLGSVRDSSFIEQEADTVLYVWRLKDDRWVTVVKVAKNRKRGIIDEKVGLILKDGKYVETTLSEDK